MAILQMNMYSHCLAMDTSLNILLPESKHGVQEKAVAVRKEYPVLYVLHGYGDNYSSWMRKSILEFVARDYDVVVVMPEVNNSFYANQGAARYYDYVANELPDKIVQFFPASTKREDTFIMGNSMGGYGAFMIAMNSPEKYAAAVSFSGILGLDADPKYLLMKIPDFKQNWEIAFHTIEEFHRSRYYLYDVARQLDQSPVKKPALFHFCGTKDILAYDMGKDFIAYTKAETTLDIRYEEIENGLHDWATWNPYIEKALQFFGLEKRPPAIYDGF